MGQVVLEAPESELSQITAKLMATLRQVDWNKGDHWLGIAGNYTSSGVFSVKGTKEVSYAVFNALTDPANGSYRRIRRQENHTPDAQQDGGPFASARAGNSSF